MTFISSNFFPKCFPNCTHITPTSNFHQNFIFNFKNPNFNYSNTRTAGTTHMVNLSTKSNLTRINSLNFTDTQCLSTLHKLRKAQKFDECLDYLKSIVDKGYKPDVGFCVQLIRSFFRSKKFKEGVEVLEILEVFCEPDVSVYKTLIHGFCKNRIIGSAIQVLGHMRNRGIKPDVQSYAYIIVSLCCLKTLELAVKSVKEMGDANCMPNVITYLILIGSKIVGGEIEEAVELIEKVFSSEGFELNIRTYSNIVTAMCRDGQMDRAFDLIHILHSKGYEPRVLPYNCLLYPLLKERKWKYAEKVIKEMLVTKCEPDNHTYIMMMEFLLRDGRIEEAMTLLNLMMEKGLRLDGSFVPVISNFYKEGMLDFTVRSIDYMIACSCFPKITSYHPFLVVLCKNGNIDDAMRIIKKLVDVGYSPTVDTYNIMVGYLWNQGDRSLALEMVSEMLEKGIEPNNHLYLTLISRLCRDGMVDEALALLRDMETPGVFYYRPVLLGLCKARRTDEAIQVLEEMVEEGCKPNETIYSVLIEGIVYVGRRAEARELTEHLFAMGVLSRKLGKRLNKVLTVNGCYQGLTPVVT